MGVARWMRVTRPGERNGGGGERSESGNEESEGRSERVSEAIVMEGGQKRVTTRKKASSRRGMEMSRGGQECKSVRSGRGDAARWCESGQRPVPKDATSVPTVEKKNRPVRGGVRWTATNRIRSNEKIVGRAARLK